VFRYLFEKCRNVILHSKKNIVFSKGFKSNLYIFRPLNSVLVAHNYRIRLSADAELLTFK